MVSEDGHIRFSMLDYYGVFLGCSDRSGASSDFEKKREIIECCNGKTRCICDFISEIRSCHYKGKVIPCNNNITIDDNHLLNKLSEEKKSDQEKFDKQAQYLKSQKVDILKDSIRFKFVFASCWVKYSSMRKI